MTSLLGPTSASSSASSDAATAALRKVLDSKKETQTQGPLSDNVDALQLLGVMALEDGRPDDALKPLSSAVVQARLTYERPHAQQRALSLSGPRSAAVTSEEW